MTLVGRGRDLRLLVDTVTARGRSAVLTGPAGIGKTALVGAAAAELGSGGWAVEMANGSEVGQEVPFGPFLHLHDVAAPPSQTSREQLVRLAAQLRLRAGARPVAVLVDDAHLLDRDSQLLVRHLVRWESMPVVAAGRTPPGLGVGLTDLVTDGLVTALDVEALSREGSDELVEQLLDGRADDDVRREVWRVAGGNPLFVRELLRESQARGAFARGPDGRWALHGPLTTSSLLGDVIEHRLSQLDEASRSLLDTLAVAGPLRMDLVERLLSREAIDALEAGDLITTRPIGPDDLVDVGHPMYAEVSREHSSGARLQRAQRRAADAIHTADSGRPGDLLLEARLRLDCADDGDAAVDLYAAAAHQALAAFDGRLALRCADAARARPEMYVVRASALGLVGRHDEARALFESLVGSATDPGELAAIVVQQARHLLIQEGRPDRARDAVAGALDRLPAALARQLLAYLTWITFLGGDPEGAVLMVEPLMVDGVPPEDLGAQVAYASALAVLGRPDGALEVVERWIGTVQSLDFDAAIMALTFTWLRILSLWQVGRAPEADDPFAPFPAVVREQLAEPALNHLGMQATQAFVRGHLARGIEGYEALGPVLRAAPLPISVHNSALLATMYAQRGDHDEARAVLAFVDEVATPDLATFRWWTERARLITRAVEGDVDGAVADSLALADEYEHIAFQRTTSLHDVVRFGDAARVVEALSAQRERDGATWWDRVCAEHADAAHAVSPPALMQVSDALATGGLDLLACEAAAQAARICRGTGVRTGERAASTRVTELLAVTGTLRTPALQTAPAELTAREHEVARLAARGASTQEIAEQLGTSPRTVGNQLQQVYDKLGVHTRSELAARLERDSR